MKALVQRVAEAEVRIDGARHDAIGAGLLIFLGVGRADIEKDAAYLASRCADLRIFEDEAGKMDRSLKEIKGKALVISQFTLCADTRKGNRPSFLDAAPPDAARLLYLSFLGALKSEIGGEAVHAGVFGAMMDIHLINRGPVTISIDSK